MQDFPLKKFFMIDGHRRVKPYSFIVWSIWIFNILYVFIHPSTSESSSVCWHLGTSIRRCPLIFSISFLSMRVLRFVSHDCACAKVAPWSTMVVCFSSSSILILLAPLPMPMPAPAQVLTGWHCANLPPPSLSFVAHPSVALPPISTFLSLSLSLISFIHFLNHLPSLYINCLYIYITLLNWFMHNFSFHKWLCKLSLHAVIWETLFGTWKNA